MVVMDDSRLMRTVLTKFLEVGGHTPEAWEPMSAMEIMEKVAASPMDLLVCDYQMPGANGATVAKMAHKARPELPVLVLTSLRDPETMDLLRKCKVRGIIHKPITDGEFLRAVDEALASKGT
ncbi:MAG TPA: response regulator [Holophagaceae bacterium]|nr:response regulator [Holophagaceae bacterium]